MKDLDFEQLESNIGSRIYRAKIPGGWLVVLEDDKPVCSPSFREGGLEYGYDWRHSVTFVPDPLYLWVTEPKVPEGYGNALGEVF